MLTFLATCYLGAVLLNPCDAETADVARVYSAVAAPIPAEYLALIRGLYWTPDRHGEANWSTLRVGLPRKPSGYVLAHEAAHIVSATNLPLFARYGARFWPNGYPVDGLPTSYARTNVAEDFAEAAAHCMVHDVHDMRDRAQWLTQNLPELHC